MNEKGHAALVIIDVQRALFEKPKPVYHAEDLLHNIDLLSDAARQAGMLVIYVQHSNKSFLLEESEGWQLHPALKPAPADLMIRKQHGSALQDTPLHQELQSRGIDTLVVMGLVTNGCIKATCEDAQKHGYRVILVEDGHSSFHKDAAKIVAEWNQKFSDAGIDLIAARDVDFVAV